MSDAYIHCRYCAYKCLRFRGKGKPNYRVLVLHVIDLHRAELESALGIQNLDVYMQEVEDTEDRFIGEIV